MAEVDIWNSLLVNDSDSAICNICNEKSSMLIMLKLKHRNICGVCLITRCIRCKQDIGMDFVSTDYYIGTDNITVCSKCNDNTLNQWIIALDENIINK